MMSAAAIRAHAVTKRYPTGTVALLDLSVAVETGQLVALVGPSGAGKTTLFRLCNGAVKPTAGDLEVLGVSVAAARGQALQRLRRRVAVVYQSHNLVGSLSVLNNVLIGRLGRVSLLSAVRGVVWPSEHERLEAVELLDQLGIADKLLSRVDDLSGGQKQRVAIARALIQRPELLLADEPVASVDAETATVILDLLARTCRERGTTAIVSLHQHQYIERYCDRMLELRAGALVRSAQVSADGLLAEGKVLVAP
ncbi:MAG: ATP-binding cassette domain-containing protein [Chloroflexi bacterium]|nr:ATP-binding cassette domain-containing protein [Chloroflexota bacterium]